MDIDERIKLINKILERLNTEDNSTVPELLDGFRIYPKKNSELDRKYRVIENELEHFNVAKIKIDESGDNTSFGYHFFTITPIGIDLVISNKSIRTLYEKEQQLEEREHLEFEKTKVDLVLAKKMLEEFPNTKWFARIGLLIAVVLALKELYIWIAQLP